ncbi:MAG: hypothetical protein RMK32_06805 [Anaerolineae bacterium]|nr:hypothetical protein [Anaerolineae bacterium]
MAALTIDRNNPNALYVGTYGDGVCKSTDRGAIQSWISNRLSGEDAREVWAKEGL